MIVARVDDAFDRVQHHPSNRTIPSTPETTHMKRDAKRRLILERIAWRMAKSWNQIPEISKREEPTETMVFVVVVFVIYERKSSGLVLVFPKEY